MKFFLRFLSTTVAIIIAGAIMHPHVMFDSYFTTIILALVLGLLNQFVKPLLILFTLPATLFSFGLFLLVINTVIILIAEYFVKGFTVSGFWWAMLFSIVISIISNFIQRLLIDNRPPKNNNNNNGDFTDTDYIEIK